MNHLRNSFVLAIAISLVATACGAGPSAQPSGSGAVSSEPFVMLSTQFNNVTESEAVRKDIIAGFTIASVDYLGSEAGPFVDRITAETKTAKGQVGVIGGVHGDFAGFPDLTIFEDLTPLAQRLKDRGIAQEFLDLGKLGTNRQVYIPWMQATYIMGINKQAFAHLPSGVTEAMVKEGNLTYLQLRDWCKNIADKTGQKRCGFPAGPKSLLHRLIQGYMYPAYTGGLVTTYKSADAVKMWTDLKDLWQYVNPLSLQIDFMQESLLSGQVWVGFDHVARLVEAFKLKPNDFVGVPAPKGPKGLYYMSVLAGLGIPKSSPNKAGAEAFIDYMTTSEVQAKTLNAVAFFPVLDKPLPSNLAAHLKLEADAVQAQSKAADAKVALLPIGLGAKGGEFNKVQLDTFQRIIIKGEDIQKVLNEEGANLQKVMTDSKAPCWRPDPASTGPCQVK
ncbi:MAG: ABC transporter substrate-binding protein [Chloroflexota bacterium]